MDSDQTVSQASFTQSLVIFNTMLLFRSRRDKMLILSLVCDENFGSGILINSTDINPELFRETHPDFQSLDRRIK